MNYNTIKIWLLEKLFRRKIYLRLGKWKMRNGEIAVITNYAYKDMLSDFPLQGTIKGKDECWQKDGRYYRYNKSKYDLMKWVGK